MPPRHTFEATDDRVTLHVHPFWPLAVAALAFALVFVAFVTASLSARALTCERGGMCVVSDAGLFGDRMISQFPAATLTGATVRDTQTSSKRGMVEAQLVELRIGQAVGPFTEPETDKAHQAELAARINDFAAGNGQRLRVVDDHRGLAYGLAALVGGLGLAGFVALMTDRRAVVDRRTHTLTRLTRSVFGRKEQVFQRAAIVGIESVAQSGMVQIYALVREGEAVKRYFLGAIAPEAAQEVVQRMRDAAGLDADLGIG